MIAQMIKKDLRIELRGKRIVSVYLPISILIAIVISSAATAGMLSANSLLAIFPGLLWLGFVFSATVSIGKIYDSESEHSALDALFLLKVAPWKIFLAKFIAACAIILPVHLISAAVLAVLLNVSLIGSILNFCLISFLVVVGYASLSVLLGAIAQSSAMKHMLLPLIMIPLLFPLLFCAINLTLGLINTASIDFESIWLSLLVGLDVLYIVLGINLYEAVIKE